MIPPGVSAGQTVQVEVPPRVTTTKHGFNTLLEAFTYCDPAGSGNITDKLLFAEVAKKLVNEVGDVELLWSQLDQDGNGAVNFPEFVEWAETHNVDLDIGLEDRGGDKGKVSLPKGWQGPKHDLTWNKRIEVTDAKLFDELKELMEVSYKKVWTRDRRNSGVNKVPDGFQLFKAQKNENYGDWKRYYLKRHMMAHTCSLKPFVQFRALTENAKDIVKRNKLRPYVNEWFLFHGTSTEAAERICESDFTMSLAGSATGTLYGRGTYFAESVTKADEYAKLGSDGLCAMLVCRVVGGYVLYTDEVEPDAQTLQEKVIAGQYHSILGDRERCRNTYKEYIVFDADQVYVDYILHYKRLFASDASRSTSK